MKSVPFGDIAERLVPRRAPYPPKNDYPGEEIDLCWRQYKGEFWTFYHGQQLRMFEPVALPERSSNCWY